MEAKINWQPPPTDAQLAVMLKSLAGDGDTAQRSADIFISVLEGQTLAALGIKYGVTRERIRQIFFKHLRVTYRFFEKNEGDFPPSLQKLRNEPTMAHLVSTAKRLEVAAVSGAQAFIDQHLVAQKSLAGVEMEATTPELREFLSKPPYWLDVSTRASNALKSCVPYDQEATIADVLKLTLKELQKLPNLGKKSLEEVIVALKKNGLKLQPNKATVNSTKIN